MARGGQNRKPRQLKVVQGTFRKDRNPAREPEGNPITDPPRAPSTLNRWGKRLWKQVVVQLTDNGVLTDLDLPALEQLCQEYGIAAELYDAVTHYVDEDGKRKRQSIAEYLAGRNSQTMPEVAVMRQAKNAMKSYLEQFGLTPASRNRIDLGKGEEKEEDPMEALLNEA